MPAPEPEDRSEAGKAKLDACAVAGGFFGTLTGALAPGLLAWAFTDASPDLVRPLAAGVVLGVALGMWVGMAGGYVALHLRRAAGKPGPPALAAALGGYLAAAALAGAASAVVTLVLPRL